MRGKGPRSARFFAHSGITPACAGKSALVPLNLCLCGDHPRVCGEKPWLTLPPWLWLGSPPRMRGKGFFHFAHEVFEGITPACAGKSHFSSRSASTSWDHPRVCGEKISFFFTGCSPKGSPPRMRGKELDRLYKSGASGITPAYAGKRPAGRSHHTCRWDHPRVCGEKH